MPSFIYSDNGTNLKVASLTVIPKWISNIDPDVLDYCTSHKVKWKFVTEKTPWAGGVYEAMVKLVKRNLKMAVGKKQLEFFKMLTLLCQVEAFINCRPLTYVSSDEHQVILRPVDFVAPFIKPGLPHIDMDSEDPNFSTGSNHETLIALWVDLQARLNKFKELFVQDYLAMLRDRKRHHHQTGLVVPRAPRVGEVVIIYEENYDPVYWKLGKVVAVVYSQDSRCRTAKVLTASGKTLNRPINHLYPLEVDDNSMSDLTEAVKASSLKKIYLQDPSAFKHVAIEKVRVVDEEAEEKEEEEPAPQKTHSMTTRGDSKKAKFSVSSVLAMNPLVILLFCMICCIPFSSAERCPKGITWEKVYQSNSFQKLYSVHMVNKRYCWRENYYSLLNLNDMNPDKLCENNQSCGCPIWSFGCSKALTSDHNSNSTVNHPIVRQALKAIKPVFCSFENSDHCHHVPFHKELPQIQLLDDSRHYVEEMHILHHQVHTDSFKCFGDDTRGFDGPPEYCEHHNCFDDSNSVCVPTFEEKHFIRTPRGNVEVKAWGMVKALVYLPKPLPSITLVTSCQKGQLSVQGYRANDVLQIDYLKSTKLVKTQDQNTGFTLPRLMLLVDQNVTVTCWQKGLKVVTKTQVCPKEEFCKHVDCIFCPELLANFSCISGFWYIFSVVLILLVAFALIELVYLLCKKKRGKRAALLRRLVDFCRSCFKLEKTPKIEEEIELNEIKDQEADSTAISPQTLTRSPSVPLIRYNTSLLICVVILSVLVGFGEAGTQVISYQAENRFCVRTAEGILKCEHNHVAHFTVKDKNYIEMIFQDDLQHPQATLTLKITPIATCIKGHSVFTRLVKVKVYSSQRCPGAGSCIDKVCEDTVSDTSIPELALVKDKPGVTRCVSSCACWGCGCFICTESCTFYKYYAVEQDSLVYESFSCRRWVFGADIEIVQRTNHKTESFKFHLEEGMVQEYNHLRISLPAVRSSDVMNFKNFLFDGKRLALSNDASKDAMSLLNCKSKFDAENMSCKLSQETCNCLPAGDGVNCQCKDNSIIKKELDISYFPNESAQIKLNDSRVYYVLEDSTTEVIVETKNFEVVTQLDYNSCHLINSSIQGCANCDDGAFVFLQCQSDFGFSLASVQCETFTFSVLCDANFHIVTLDLNTTNVFLSCTLQCPANFEKFNITGTLHFIQDNPLNPEKEKATSNISWSHAIKSFFGNLLNFKFYLIIVVFGILLIIVLLK